MINFFKKLTIDKSIGNPILVILVILLAIFAYCFGYQQGQKSATKEVAYANKNQQATLAIHIKKIPLVFP
jgi:hypothetical protein